MRYYNYCIDDSTSPINTNSSSIYRQKCIILDRLVINGAAYKQWFLGTTYRISYQTDDLLCCKTDYSGHNEPLYIFLHRLVSGLCKDVPFLLRLMLILTSIHVSFNILHTFHRGMVTVSYQCLNCVLKINNAYARQYIITPQKFWPHI